jgi:hypothetical protein
LKIFIIATAAGCAMALLLLTSLWTGPWPPAAAAPGCGCVAFRLDDIQDYFLREVQMEVINIFDRKDASLTVGVSATTLEVMQRLSSLSGTRRQIILPLKWQTMG